jgi:hypothetical protein
MSRNPHFLDNQLTYDSEPQKDSWYSFLLETVENIGTKRYEITGKRRILTNIELYN